MGAPYRCGTEARRAAVAASGAMVGALALNGIDFLEVVDRDAADPALRQRVLHLHFLKPDGVAAIGPGNLRIEGGARITGIRVVSVAPLPGSDRALLLTLDRYGDYSRYLLRVVDDAGQDPPPHLDLPLAEVAFTFKTDCPTGFDCAEAPACPPAPAAFPLPDAVARDYESFRGLMLDRLAATVPGWTSRNPADLGITLVELLSDAADRLAYLQDAAATEAYLGTARRRASVRRHARLTGYRMAEGSNARTVVCLAVSGDIAPVDAAGTPLPVLPAGTQIIARLPRGAALAEEEAETLLPHAAVVFETLEEVTALRAAANAIPFHGWGERGCCLPRGATHAALRRPAPGFTLRRGEILVLQEGAGADGAPADPTRRHAVRLAADAVVRRDHVAGLDVLEIAWHAADALPFALRVDAAVACGNAILADEGRSMSAPGAELDPPEPWPGRPWRPRLPEASGLVHAAPFDAAAARARPVADALRQAAGATLAAVRLHAEGEAWAPRPDLLGLDRFAPAFVVETEPGERPALRFGDGVFGRAPPARFDTLRWRRGGGAAGNVGSDALAHLVVPRTALRARLREGRAAGRFAFADDAAAEVAAAAIAADLAACLDAVRNPIPATGGTAPETLVAAKLAAPQAFRVNARAVTPADYARAAEAHEEVTRAVAERRWMGSWHVVTIAVDRAGRRPVDASFEAALVRHLERYRLAGHDIEIEPPRFVPLDIALWVCVAPGFVARDVERALADRFTSGLRRDGAPGFFHPDRFTFGQDVPLSPLIAEAMGVQGVAWVGIRRPGGGAPGQDGHFRRLREPGTDYADAGAIPLAPLEIAVLDNDPGRPEDGRLRFRMEGGL